MTLSVRDYPAARYCLHTGVTTDDREWHALRLAWLSARARLLTEAAEWVDLAARDANAGSDGWRSSEFAWLVSFLARHVGSRESSFPLRNKDLIGEVIEAARPEERLPNLVTAIFGDLPSSMDSVGAAMRDWLDYRGPSLRECIIGPSAGGDGTRRCETGLAHAGDPMRDEIPGTMVELWDEAGRPIVLAALQTGSRMPSARAMIGIRRWSRSAPGMLLDTVVAASPIRSSGEGWLVRLHGGDLLTSWSLRLNVPGLPTGWASRDEHAVGDLGRDRLSDLLLAQADRAVVYQAAHEPVLVPLDDELHRRVPAELFFQIRSAAADSATMSLTIVREGHRPGERELAISERVELVEGLREVRRSLDLRELESGWYALEVAIAFDQGGSARRTVRFRVR